MVQNFANSSLTRFVAIYLVIASCSSGNEQKAESTDSESSDNPELNDKDHEDTVQVESGTEVANDVTGSYLTFPSGIKAAGQAKKVHADFPEKKLAASLKCNAQ